MVQSAQLSGGRASRSAAALTVALISLVLGGWVLIWNDDGGGPFPVVLIHNGRASVPYLLTLVALAANLAHRASTPAGAVDRCRLGRRRSPCHAALFAPSAGQRRNHQRSTVDRRGSSRCGQHGDTSGEWTTHRSRSHLLHCRVGHRRNVPSLGGTIRGIDACTRSVKRRAFVARHLRAVGP